MTSALPPTFPSTAPPPISPRFTLELEFVLCLSNPFYLQHLAVQFPHLLNPPVTDSKRANTAPDSDETDYARFTRYLAYLYSYWRTPAYSQYLTHPGAVLRNLELLQQEQFRKDIIRPDVIARLFETEAPAEGEGGGPGPAIAAGATTAVQPLDERVATQATKMDTSAG